MELTADEERLVAESYWRYRRFWSLLAMALLVSAAKETLMVRPKNDLTGALEALQRSSAGPHLAVSQWRSGVS